MKIDKLDDLVEDLIQAVQTHATLLCKGHYENAAAYREGANRISLLKNKLIESMQRSVKQYDSR